MAVEPDDRDRYLAKTLGVSFRVAPSGKDLILEDASTGEVIRKLPDEAKARREEAAAREAAERRADEAVEAREAAEAKVRELLAEVERLKAFTG